MNYTCEKTIDLPREKVAELFEKQENLPKWQSGLKNIKHISGVKGKKGAVTRLRFKMNGRKMSMTQTILDNSMPEECELRYETGGVVNQQVNRFESMGSGRTKWRSINVFRFSGSMKIISLLMKGYFPKQTRKIMENFKQFAEEEVKKAPKPQPEPNK